MTTRRPTRAPDGPTPRPPSLEDLDSRRLTPVDVAALADLDDAEGLIVRGSGGGPPRRLDWDGLVLQECALDSLAASEVHLESARLRQCRLVEPDVVTIAGASSMWDDVEVRGGRVASLDLHAARLTSLVFSGLRLGYVNLRGCTASDVVFDGCTIDTLDLPGAVAQRVRFVATRADEVELRQARLSDVDLRGLDVGTLGGIEALHGTTISSVQLQMLAPAIARSLGITVDDA